jgi:hypothetical protein
MTDNPPRPLNPLRVFAPLRENKFGQRRTADMIICSREGAKTRREGFEKGLQTLVKQQRTLPLPEETGLSIAHIRDPHHRLGITVVVMGKVTQTARRGRSQNLCEPFHFLKNLRKYPKLKGQT